MTEVSLSPASGTDLGTYKYTSEPHTISNGRSPRNHNAKNGRVIRGSNYSKDAMPKWNPYFAHARSLSRNEFQLYETDELQLKRNEFRKKLEERAKLRRENLGISSLYASKNGSVVLRRTTLGPKSSVDEVKLRELVSNIIRDSAIEVAEEAAVEQAALHEYLRETGQTLDEVNGTAEKEHEKETDLYEERSDPEGKEMSIEGDPEPSNGEAIAE